MTRIYRLPLDFNNETWDKLQNLKRDSGAKNNAQLIQNAIAILASILKSMEKNGDEPVCLHVNMIKKPDKTIMMIEIPINTQLPKHLPEDMERMELQLEFGA